jgi:hypothetical protein
MYIHTYTLLSSEGEESESKERRTWTYDEDVREEMET